MNAATIAERHVRETGVALDLGSRTDAVGRGRHFRRLGGVVEDVGLWLLVLLLLPVVIFLVGAPIALAIRAIVELVRLFS